MGRRHSRRCSRSLKGHQSCILGSVFSLTVSLNPQLKSCRFEPHLKVIWTLARQGCLHRHAHRHTHGWSDSQDSYRHSPHSWRSVQVGRIQEVQGCCSWIRCSPQGRFIWSDALQGSCSQVLASAEGIKSLLSLQRATPGLFILRILFRILQLRERLQFLQPRERVVQIKEYLILQDYISLSLQNLKLEGESLESNPFRVRSQHDHITQARNLGNQWLLHQ